MSDVAIGRFDSNATQTFLRLLRHFSRPAGGDSFSGDLISPQSLHAIAYSDERRCPAFDGTNDRRIARDMATVAFAGLMQKNLDWQAVRDEARRLAGESRSAAGEAKFSAIETLGETPETTFARDWSAAWSSRNVERLLSLFCDDGIFSDAGFEVCASGKPQLRKLFGAIFHSSDMPLSVEQIKLSPDCMVLKWMRRGTRLHGVAFSRDRYDFPGASRIELSGGHVAICEDTWETTDGMMHVLLSRPPRSA
jgi:SnoaL-like domain